MTIGEAIFESINFKYSNEFYDLLKESYELDLMSRMIDRNSYINENKELIDEYMKHYEESNIRFESSDNDVIVDEYDHKKKSIFQKIKTILSSLFNKLKNVFLRIFNKKENKKDFEDGLIIDIEDYTIKTIDENGVHYESATEILEELKKQPEKAKRIAAKIVSKYVSKFDTILQKYNIDTIGIEKEMVSNTIKFDKLPSYILDNVDKEDYKKLSALINFRNSDIVKVSGKYRNKIIVPYETIARMFINVLYGKHNDFVKDYVSSRDLNSVEIPINDCEKSDKLKGLFNGVENKLNEAKPGDPLYLKNGINVPKHANVEDCSMLADIIGTMMDLLVKVKSAKLEASKIY